LVCWGVFRLKVIFQSWKIKQVNSNYLLLIWNRHFYGWSGQWTLLNIAFTTIGTLVSQMKLDELGLNTLIQGR
jgi:hypothetical protein